MLKPHQVGVVWFAYFYAIIQFVFLFANNVRVIGG